MLEKRERETERERLKRTVICNLQGNPKEREGQRDGERDRK